MFRERLFHNPLSKGIIPPHPAGLQAKRPLEPVQPRLPEIRPPTFPIQSVQEENTVTKKTHAQEYNMKFPTPMEFKRRIPQSSQDGASQPREGMTQLAIR